MSCDDSVLDDFDVGNDEALEEKNVSSLSSMNRDQEKTLLIKEIRTMMYGYGDDERPYDESVDLMAGLTVDFIHDMTRKAMRLSQSNKVAVEDLYFLVRKDDRKFSRIQELLTTNEELKIVRRAFDESKYVQAELPRAPSSTT